MTEKSIDVSTTKPQDITRTDKDKNEARKKLLRLAAISCNPTSSDDFDFAKAIREAQQGLVALEASGRLQEMLAAQMLSIHRFQQMSMAMVNETAHMNQRQYFTNATIKLANTFVQQANLLAKLQGHGGQKITIERVDVHHGGQAVVGNINGGTIGEVKK